jgi:large subunit ribosomal protein L4
MRASALRSVLADRAAEGRVWVLDGFVDTKTRVAAKCLEAAGIAGRVLIVLDPRDDDASHVDRAFRNLEGVAFSLYGSLAAHDVLVAEYVVFTASALDRYTSRRKGHTTDRLDDRRREDA